MAAIEQSKVEGNESDFCDCIHCQRDREEFGVKVPSYRREKANLSLTGNGSSISREQIRTGNTVKTLSWLLDGL